MDYRLIMYDYEVFRHDWLVVFRDYETGNECVIVNDIDKLTRFYNAAKDCIFCGYNNRNYDDVIFKGLLVNKNPYKMTQELIEQGLKGYQVLPRAAKDIQLYSYDVSTGFHSLKQLEGFLGINIEETSVPFDIDRKLTEEEIAETIKYCKHDVRSTVKVFDAKKKDFEAHIKLIEMFNLDLKFVSKTKAQLSATILDAEKQPHDDEWDIELPTTLKLDKYSFVKDWFLSDEISKPKAKYSVELAGVPHEFALGGLHGATKKQIYDGIIGCWDVSSFYPATIILYDLMSRNVSDRNKYREIRDLRIKYKGEGNPLQAPLKLILNSTYGILNDKYNPMYDPRQAHRICVYCQLFLLDLIEKIELACGENAQLIQSNTDGTYWQFKTEEDLQIAQKCVDEWEQRTGYEMELDRAKKIIQRDVNNYLLVTEDGHVKSKGAVVKQLSKIDYDLPVINKAVNEYFKNGTLVEDYINSCNDLIEYQKIYKVTSNYKYAMLGDEPIYTKVNRIFASKDKSDGAFYKLKKGKETPDKFAGTPDHSFIDNGGIVSKLIPEKLDKQWYINRAIKEIEKFVGIKYEREGVKNEK